MVPPINCYDAPGSRLKDCLRILWRREVPEPVIQPDSDSLVQVRDLQPYLPSSSSQKGGAGVSQSLTQPTPALTNRALLSPK